MIFLLSVWSSPWPVLGLLYNCTCTRSSTRMRLSSPTGLLSIVVAILLLLSLSLYLSSQYQWYSCLPLSVHPLLWCLQYLQLFVQMSLSPVLRLLLSLPCPQLSMQYLPVFMQVLLLSLLGSQWSGWLSVCSLSATLMFKDLMLPAEQSLRLPSVCW